MSRYKVMALVNPKAAIIKLLKDFPDGKNRLSIKKELDISMKKTNSILKELQLEDMVDVENVGPSEVFYIVEPKKIL